MKTRKVNFSELENNMKREEKMHILGGGANTLDQLGPSDDTDLDYSSGGGFGMTGFGQGPFVSGSANNFSELGSYGNSSYSSGFYTGWNSNGGSYGGSDTGYDSNYTSGWTQTNDGIVTNDPNIIKRIVDYLDWERVILKNEPTIAQINNFINIDYLTGGKGILSDGSTLAQGMSITHDPYGEFKTIENLIKVFQDFGDSLTVGGAALSLTGVGAIVGGPMMSIGGGISKIGTVAEFYLDVNSTEPFDYTKWGIKIGLNYVPDVYTQLFTKRAGVIGADNAMIEMYAVASDRWFDYMGTVRK